MPLTYFLSKIKYVSSLDVPSFTDITAIHEAHETGKLHNPHFLYIEHALQALAYLTRLPLRNSRQAVHNSTIKKFTIKSGLHQNSLQVVLKRL